MFKALFIWTNTFSSHNNPYFKDEEYYTRQRGRLIQSNPEKWHSVNNHSVFNGSQGRKWIQVQRKSLCKNHKDMKMKALVFSDFETSCILCSDFFLVISVLISHV